jgi:ssDNA-specific exonuclease RecJ
MPNFDTLYQKYREEASRYLKDLKRRDYFQELYDIAEAKANLYQQCIAHLQKNKNDLAGFLNQISLNESNIPKTVVDKELYLDTWEREVKKIIWGLD